MTTAKWSESEHVKKALSELDATARALFVPWIIDKVEWLIQEGDKSGERISAWEAIAEILLANNLAVMKQEQSPFCAIDPDNRNHLGASGGSSQLHGQACLGVGWSAKKLRRRGRRRAI